MGLQYKYKGKFYSLEEIIKIFNIKNIWNELLIYEYNFLNKVTLDDLILETSDALEEYLLEHNKNIEFIDTIREKFDYNYLLDALRDEESIW